MEDQAKLVDGVGPLERAAKRNRGHFVAGDPRINRRGRPVGAEAAARRSAKGKSPTGRVRRLILSQADLCHRLMHERSFWIPNLPKDVRFVGMSPDPDSNLVVLLIYSMSFSPVQEGQPVPRFVPTIFGRDWLRRARKVL